MTNRPDLRVVNADPPEGLFSAGSSSVPVTTPLQLADEANQDPIALLRVGPKDLPAALEAIMNGVRVSALVSGINEPLDFTRRMRRVQRRLGVPWIVDPLLFQTALPRYQTATHLTGLDYTPPRGKPYTVHQLRRRQRRRALGRDVIGAQAELGPGALLTGSFVASRPGDEFIAITQDVVDAGIAARDAVAQLPILVPLPVRMGEFSSLEAQRLLLRAFQRRQGDALVLMLDGVGEGSSVDRLASALRFALLAKATGTRVLVSRPGDLRRFFLAFGIDGIEFGLGRFLRFAIPDYRRSGGQGPAPGVRFEAASLVGSLPSDQAEEALGLELIAEADCHCRACTVARDPRQQVRSAPLHDALTVHDQLGGLGRIPVDRRVGDLVSDLTAASHDWAELDRRGISREGAIRVDNQRKAIELVVEWGYLEPGHAEEALG